MNTQLYLFITVQFMAYAHKNSHNTVRWWYKNELSLAQVADPEGGLELLPLHLPQQPLLLPLHLRLPLLGNRRNILSSPRHDHRLVCFALVDYLVVLPVLRPLKRPLFFLLLGLPLGCSQGVRLLLR